MFPRLKKQLAKLTGCDSVPLPWRKLKKCALPTRIILTGLDSIDSTPGSVGPVLVLRNRLATDLSHPIIPKMPPAIPRTPTQPSQMGIDTIEATGYLRIYSWETGGGRPWRKREPEILRELSAALVFVVDVADTDRLVEAREEYQQFLRHCPCGLPSLVLVVNGAATEVKACFDPTGSSTKSIHYAAVDLGTGAGLFGAYTWLVDEHLRAAQGHESI